MRKRAVRAVLALVLLDVAAIVVSGGVSLFGPVEVAGVVLRLVLAAFLLGLDFLACGKRRANDYGYILLLLLLVPLLHFRGYRLRGDGLWYYSYAHSIAFDFDIELENQYRRLGIETMTGSLPVRETGRARFTYPVGAPIAWVPFVEAGHLGAALRNAHGFETAYDGFSDPYFHAVALGNLLLGFAGLLLLDRLLRKWFPAWVAFLATAGIGLGTFLTWYLTYHAIYTHALTFLLVTWFLYRWASKPETVPELARLGLVLGLAVLTRWQNAVFVLLPAWTFLESLRMRKPGALVTLGWRAGALAAGILAGVLPQLLSWKILYDRFYVGVPLGEEYMRWDDPFLSEILFSSRHGLFSWSPLLIAAAIGFLGFLKRERRVGLPLAVVALIVWYVNSVVADWWGGGSFGGRRFDSLLPILALGLAVAVSWAATLVERHPRWVVGFVLALAIASNGLLMEQYRKGRLPADDTISWETASEGKLEDLFDAVGYPFSFPMNWLFALRYDRPKTQYDILVGKYLFHRMHGLDGVIDLGIDDAPFLGNGWTGLRDFGERAREVRHAVGPRAGLFVPLHRIEGLRVFLECAVPEGLAPVPIEVRLNGVRIGAFSAGAEMAEYGFTAEASWWKRLNLLELVPAQDNDGFPYLAVDGLRFERLH
jgi:hypothetical protein